MSRNEIISMAREAGAKVFGEKIVIADNASSGDGSEFVPRFAALVAARERVSIVTACSALYDSGPENGCCPSHWNEAIDACIEAIRARADNEVRHG